ncbi:LamG domain-containing protein [Entomomonas sp. E2T0]|uniref:LamG domain-containing protein n=1 Tax=Entomomonas sp. E2T0 TaxID=2930213 RepID=UPI0022284A69|nr:LamG domain-containing protein [Entomomonas sp. E2T0]UYZ84275.1 LamG domain-containing protein [Entomomonas sp. E2T0]
MGGKSKKQVIGYWYGATMHMGVGLASDEIYLIKVGGKTAWSGSIKTNSTVSINNPNLFGGEKAEGGIVGTLSALFGGADQPRHSLLAATFGAAIPAFRGFVSLVFDGWLCAMNPYPKTWEIGHRRIFAKWPNENPWYPEKALISLANGQIHAMNPAHMLYESYISDSWGAGEARATMDDTAFKAAADTLYNEGFGLCIEWKITDELAKFRDTICDHIGARLDTHPLTGLTTITLIRDNYNLDELPVFTEDTGLLELKFDSSNNTEVPSQVIVKYTDAITFAECSVMANNPAIAQAQGGRSVETVDYLATPTGELATRLAYRDLKAKNSSLKRCTIKLDRRASGIVNGQPFRIKTLKRVNNIDIVVRAEKITEKFITDGAITMSCLQDVWGLPKIAFNPTPENPGQEQPLPPAPITKRLLIEAPYRELAGVIDPANLQLVDNTAAFYFVVADSPNNSCRSYNLLSRVKGATSFNQVDDLGAWCPTATLATDIDYLTKTISIDDYSLLEDVEIGTAAIINSEIVRIDGIDLVNKQLLIARGCADTVPIKHNKAAVIWFYDGYETIDPAEYNTGLIVEAKLLSNTGTEQLEESAAPLETITLQSRQAKPYPPANVKINGISYPSSVTTNPINISWVERNRLLQADQLIDTTVGDIAAEDGTTYNLRAYFNNELMISETGITANNYNLTVIGGINDVSVLVLDNEIDKTGRLWTISGNASFDTTDYKVGNASLKLAGNAWLQTTNTAAFAFGLNDFTIEAWVKLSTTNGRDRIVIDNFYNISGVRSYQMNIGSTGQLNFYSYNNGGSYVRGTSNLVNGEWHHIAVTRANGVLRLFVDGRLETTANNNVNYDAITNITAIGAQVNNRNVNYDFSGNIDQVRVTKGLARFTANFTPTTEPYDIESSVSGSIRVELEAVRDGLTSYQAHNITFNYN